MRAKPTPGAVWRADDPGCLSRAIGGQGRFSGRSRRRGEVLRGADHHPNATGGFASSLKFWGGFGRLVAPGEDMFVPAIGLDARPRDRSDRIHPPRGTSGDRQARAPWVRDRRFEHPGRAHGVGADGGEVDADRLPEAQRGQVVVGRGAPHPRQRPRPGEVDGGAGKRTADTSARRVGVTGDDLEGPVVDRVREDSHDGAAGGRGA
jgi:hypothetical protein